MDKWILSAVGYWGHCRLRAIWNLWSLLGHFELQPMAQKKNCLTRHKPPTRVSQRHRQTINFEPTAHTSGTQPHTAISDQLLCCCARGVSSGTPGTVSPSGYTTRQCHVIIWNRDQSYPLKFKLQNRQYHPGGQGCRTIARGTRWRHLCSWSRDQCASVTVL